MKIIKPKKLKKGDTIGILAVSGKINDYEKIEQAKAFFEKEGYNVVVSDTCKTSHRYLAGITDDDCVDVLHSYFQDEKIDMILCARGGYGTIRLLDKIDFNIIKNNPKIFAGYSDITLLLNMIFYNTGLITFHSPMAYGDFSSDIDLYTVQNFFKTMMGTKKTITASNPIMYKKGVSEGVLFGGNLATLTSLCGIDFILNEDIILFLEDLNEPVYKIDRMLSQLFNVQKIKEKVKGIVIGEFQNIDDEDYLNSLLCEFAEKLNVPMSSGFKITHSKEKETIPVGAKVVFDSNVGTIKIIEDYLE